MKRIILTLLLISLGVFAVKIIFFRSKPKNSNKDKVELTKPTITNNPYKETFEGYRLDWIEVSDVKKINLNTNLLDKKTSAQLFSDNYCKYLVSSGFYNKLDKHIGLFVSNSKTVSPSIKDDFFDGYFYIKNGQSQISLTEPINPEIALQSGPLILLENKFLIKTYQNDDYSRRILVGVTRKGSVVFLIIYGDNTITGPRLADIKSIVTSMENRSGVDFTNLINLDGGSHSAFLTDTVAISEISTIGGYFCIKQ